MDTVTHARGKTKRNRLWISQIAIFAVLSQAWLSVATDASDLIKFLPDYGVPKTKHYSGYVGATASQNNKLFYYFVESDVGSDSTDTPLLIWLNGGPGSSSLLGLFAENLGPQVITSNGVLVDNVHTITKKYHLMVVDNPVGAGFSYTSDDAYVRSEQEMRTQFVHALRGFFEKHPEYSKNPVWVTGESYAGKYVPNIAVEIAANATEMHLQGIIVGNGMYNETAAYSTIAEIGAGQGVLGPRLSDEVQARQKQCLEKLAKKEKLAFNWCEDHLLRWLYTAPDAAAGQFFYYDFGIRDPQRLDTIQTSLAKYLNRSDVKIAFHAENSTWQSQDETGPVARALAEDLDPSILHIAALLHQGKQVLLYNGVQDGSVCNHFANTKSLYNMEWTGAEDFRMAASFPWPSVSNTLGHVQTARNLRYVTLMRVGHMVPMIVPEVFGELLNFAINGDRPSPLDAISV